MIPQPTEGTGVWRPLAKDMFKHVAVAFNAAKQFECDKEFTEKDARFFLANLLYNVPERKAIFEIFFENLQQEYKAIFDKLLSHDKEYQQYRAESPYDGLMPYSHFIMDQWASQGYPGMLKPENWIAR